MNDTWALLLNLKIYSRLHLLCRNFSSRPQRCSALEFYEGKYHLQLLETTREAAGIAHERPLEVNDLSAEVVEQRQIERPVRAAAIPRAAVGLLLGPVELLAHRVQHQVLVVRLEARQHLQQLHLLIH